MRSSKAGIFHHHPASRAQRAVFKRATTYLARIALILRDAPHQMLTFTQLMDRLILLTSEDRKCVLNNIRVCLSSHSCFIKTPVIPDSLNSKKNYWKLDCSRITVKMVRRHFKGLLQLFPELASKLEMENLDSPSEQSPALLSPEAASCSTIQVKGEVKFTGPFSIESLLKRDSPPARTRPSPLSSGEQGPLPTNTSRGISCCPVESFGLQTVNVSPHISPAGGSTLHRLITSRAVEPFRRIPPHAEHSCAPRSFVIYSVPTFTNVTPHVWQ